MTTLRISLLFVLIALDPAVAPALPGSSGAAQSCGSTTVDASVMRQDEASEILDGRSELIKLMPIRYVYLQDVLEGFRRTGVPLVAVSGTTFVAAEHGDDAGLFFFVPAIARNFRTSLARSIDLFLGVSIGFSAVVGITGIFFLFRHPLSRAFGTGGIISLALLLIYCGDVYVVQACIAISCIPWLLYSFGSAIGVRYALFVTGLTGVCGGIVNFVRGQAGTPVLLFTAVLILCSAATRLWRTRALHFAILAAGFLLPWIYFHSLLQTRNQFLDACSTDQTQRSGQHVLWHSVYIGFGFLSNDVVPAYKDEVAAARVHAISPTAGYLSPEYERVLRQEVFQLVRQHPPLVLWTLSAKLGVILVLFLIAANIGLLSSILHPKGQAVELAFSLALGFSCLPGVLVVPYVRYLLGFCALGILYGVVSIDFALEHIAGRGMPLWREKFGGGRHSESETEGNLPGVLSCPVCGGTSLFDARSRDAVLFRCPACDHCFSDTASLVSMELYGKEYYEEVHKNWYLHPNTRFFDRVSRTLAPLGENLSVIDLGCGQGDFLRYLKQSHPSYRLTGVDIGSVRSSNDIQFVSGDVYQVKFDQQFDAVISFAVIEHVPDIHRFVARLDELCAPNGIIVVMTINERSILYQTARVLRKLGYRNAFDRLYSGHHLHHFNIRSLRCLMHTEQLPIVETLTLNAPIAAMDIPASSRFTEAILRLGVLGAFLLGALTGATYQQAVICQKRLTLVGLPKELNEQNRVTTGTSI